LALDDIYVNTSQVIQGIKADLQQTTECWVHKFTYTYFLIKYVEQDKLTKQEFICEIYWRLQITLKIGYGYCEDWASFHFYTLFKKWYNFKHTFL
jgi:hypothetical protein